jgi:hypothetical protein
MRVLLLVLSLAGCGGMTLNVGSNRTDIAVPDELKHCPEVPRGIPVPRSPRSPDAIIAWANATETQRLATVGALRECKITLEKLVALVGAK